MTFRKILKTTWKILKPIITLGLSLIVLKSTSKLGENKQIIQGTIEEAKDKLIEEIDEAIEGNKNKTKNINELIK